MLSLGFFPLEVYRLILQKPMKCFNLQQYTPRPISFVMPRPEKIHYTLVIFLGMRLQLVAVYRHEKFQSHISEVVD